MCFFPLLAIRSEEEILGVSIAIFYIHQPRPLMCLHFLNGDKSQVDIFDFLFETNSA
jgi:hypothetical protein